MESYKAKQQALDDIIDRARIGKCWNKHDDRWADAADVSLKTLQRFWDRQPIRKSNFINICEAVGIDDWEAIADSAPSSPVTSLPRLTPDWVEREDITESLLSRLQPPRRVLVLSGITGIGKTELVKRLLPELEDDKKYCSLNLDDGSLTGDFATSGAVLLRALGTEPTLEDQKDAKTLLAHIVDRLCQTPYRVQIDSLERILKGNETEGWSDFEDDLWLELFQQILAKNSCHSQLLVTTQDVPGELETVGSRYPQLWHCETLAGLSEEEQLELFANLGLGSVLDAGGEGADLLTRLGRLYEGHPLVLRVIAEDIKACGGDVARYWQQGKFAELEEQRSVRFSRRRLQTEVRERVRQSLSRLPEAALRLLCRGAVYRRPVPEGFWLALLPEVGEAEKSAALDLLKARGLALEVWEPDAWLGADGTVPLRQHNLIRQVAYGLLQREGEAWQQAERGAAAQWLAGYEPREGVERLETVRGYLEALDHYCNGEDWEAAEELFMRPLEEFDNSKLWWLLLNWSHYREQLRISQRLSDRVTPQTTVSCYNCIGCAFNCLSQYQKAIGALQKSLKIAQKIRDSEGEADALGNLGIAHHYLGKYQEAIAFHKQQLELSRKIGERWGEGNALGNLGNTYHHLGKYKQAIAFHKKSLKVKQEIGNLLGAGNAIANLALVYNDIGNYQQAIIFLDLRLKIAQKIGDFRGMGNTLNNLGIAYYNLGRYNQAIAFMEKDLEIRLTIGDRLGEGIVFNRLGAMQVKLKQYDKALKNLQASLRIFQEVQSPAFKAQALKDLAQVYLKTDRLGEALESCNAALQIATDLGIPLAQECEVLRSQIQMAQSPKNGGEET